MDRDRVDEQKGKPIRVWRVIIEARLEVGETPMPSDWIKSKAEKESKEQAEAHARQEAQQRETELIRVLGPKFVENLQNILNDDIVAWNANFKDRQINGASKITNGFQIAKLGFPRGIAEVIFNPATLRIEVTLTRSRPADANETYSTSGFFYLKTNTDGRDIHMEDRMRNTHLQPSGFSRIILESIAEPMANHII